MTTAALVKELRDRNKEIMERLAAVERTLADLLDAVKRLQPQAMTAAHPPTGSAQPKKG